MWLENSVTDELWRPPIRPTQRCDWCSRDAHSPGTSLGTLRSRVWVIRAAETSAGESGRANEIVPCVCGGLMGFSVIPNVIGGGGSSDENKGRHHVA